MLVELCEAAKTKILHNRYSPQATHNRSKPEFWTFFEARIYARLEDWFYLENYPVGFAQDGKERNTTNSRRKPPWGQFQLHPNGGERESWQATQRDNGLEKSFPNPPI